MIALVFNNNRFSPCAICDACFNKITDADLAVYVWKRDFNCGNGQVVQLSTVHKGDCLRAYESEHGEMFSEELSRLPIILAMDMCDTNDPLLAHEKILYGNSPT